MTETTQEERNMARCGVATRDTVLRLANDADRLAQAEELLSKARNQMDNPNPLSTLDERIDAFLSDGSES